MNRAFLYGDGFFETIRFQDGHSVLMTYHLQRILEALRVYGLEWEIEAPESALQSILDEAPEGTNICRISFYRAGEGRYTPMNNQALTHVRWASEPDEFWLPISMDLAQDLMAAPAQPGRIAPFPDPKPLHAIYRYKSLSSAYYVLAAKYALEHQIDHLILSDAKSHILEELRANLLFQKGAELIIPPIDSGAVLGVTQRYLLHLYGYQLTQRAVHLDELSQFDAIYSCKGSTGIRRIQ